LRVLGTIQFSAVVPVEGRLPVCPGTAITGPDLVRVSETVMKHAGGTKGYAAKLSKTLGQPAELDVMDELKTAGLEALYHWHDAAADHDVTLMVSKDRVLVEVADVVLRKKLQEKQGKT
jgi:hypothetical protein